MNAKAYKTRGFTLIELSIVLVIIGLIVGGVLVGRDLIIASQVRATITQVEKFNTATNTFRGKYGYLPGDINAAAAAQFGFTPRGTQPGQGDGNGLVEGYQDASPPNYGVYESVGETLMFWVDLTTANGLNLNLIEGGFNSASPTANPSGTATVNQLFPAAKLGGGNYFYVWSGGISTSLGNSNGVNYYGLSAFSQVPSPYLNSVAGLPIQQAYNIDTKMDDGLPQTGHVMAMYANASGTSVWAAGSNPTVSGSGGHASYNGAAPGSAQAPLSWTCYDNGGNASNPMQYSLSQGNGNYVNCALSFQFQ